MTKVFCAIDAKDFDSAKALVTKIAQLDIGLKLGLEFFIAEGLSGINKIRELSGGRHEIFLDLKLHDIPNTVAGAVRSALSCAPDYLTIHTSGGFEMMTAAVDAAAGKIKLLGVTVLTSLDNAALGAVGQQTPVDNQVSTLAALAAKAGLSGVICSPHEIARLRSEHTADFQLVVPGIRPADSAAGDQKRIMTPEQAMRAGADYLVIGRPITQAADPAMAAANILSTLTTLAA